MFVNDAPYLGSAGGAGAQLRVAAVKLQNYADVNVGAKPLVRAFWEAQKALAAADHGLPYDGVYVPGVADVRPACYKVLSHYRLFNKVPGTTEFLAFVGHFILANGGVLPLGFSRNITGSNATDEGSTYIELGKPYFNSCEVHGGTAPYTYQWKKRNGGVDANVGSNQPSYTVPSVAAGHAAEYFVIVTDAEGTIIESNRDRLRTAVRLTTNLSPEISLAHGGPVILQVVASGGFGLTYQWYKDGVALEGRTSASFNKSSSTAADSGKYYCVVKSINTTGVNTVTSLTCNIEVVGPATLTATATVKNAVGGTKFLFEDLFTLVGSTKKHVELRAVPNTYVLVDSNLDVTLGALASGTITLTAHWKYDTTVRAVQVLEGVTPKP